MKTSSVALTRKPDGGLAELCVLVVAALDKSVY